MSILTEESKKKKSSKSNLDNHRKLLEDFVDFITKGHNKIEKEKQEGINHKTQKTTEEKKEESRSYWLGMNKMFTDTMEIAKKAYRINRNINLVIVGIGMTLLANSIAFTWINNGLNEFTTITGGLSLVSFITLFFMRPQNNLTSSLGNLAQIQMIYKSHSFEFESLANYYCSQSDEISKDLEKIKEVNRELEKFTNQYIELVQKFIEESDKESCSSK